MRHINGNFLQFILVFSNSLKCKTLKKAELSLMKTKFWCPNCSYDWLHSLYIYCSFLPRFCFKYLVIHIESCSIIIFQCYKCIVISTGNQQQSENSVGNSDKPVVFMISSKGQGPGSQPEIKIATLFLNT